MTRPFVILALCFGVCRALKVQQELTDSVTVHDGDMELHDEMRSMMNDDDDDVSDSDSKSSFLQTNVGDQSDAYLSESAGSLSAALGSRWNGPELEQNAKETRQVLMDGWAKRG